jgi:hypothetical protein
VKRRFLLCESWGFSKNGVIRLTAVLRNLRLKQRLAELGASRTCALRKCIA